MPTRDQISKKVDAQKRDFLKKNPEIAKALELFDVSFSQYRAAVDTTQFPTSASSNPTRSPIA